MRIMGKRSNYRASMTLTEAIWQTVNRGTLTPEQLEDEIDYSASALKRAGLDGESGAGLNVKKMIPLMRAQDDYTILEHLNHRCGFVMIPIPRGGKSKKEKIADVAEYQKLASAAVHVLVRMINDGASREEALDTLYQMLRGTAQVMDDVKAGAQIPIEF